MEDVYKSIIDYLTPEQLNDIYVVNKLRLQGFRSNAKNTVAKTTKMKQELIKKQYLKDYINKLLDYYKDTLKIDYTWALVNPLSKKAIQLQLKQKNNGEVIIGLLLAEKNKELKSLLLQLAISHDEKTEHPDSKDLVINNSSDSNEINNLRKLLKLKEDELNKIIKSNILMSDKNLRLNNEITELNEIKNKQKRELIRIEKIIEKYERDLTNYTARNSELELHLKRNEYILEDLTGLKIAVVGGNSFKNYWITKCPKIKNIKFNYYSRDEFLGIEDTNQVHHILILIPTLNNADLNIISQQKIYKKYQLLKGIIFLNSHEEINNYIERVGNYYE